MIDTQAAGRVRWWWLAAAGLAFAFASTWAPHFYSNQHQYFLHGFAHAGFGDLANDWVANTTDPTPVFSWLIASVVRWLPMAILQMLFVLLMVLYLASLWWIVSCEQGGSFEDSPRATRANGAMVFAILIVAHAGIVRWASVHWLGKDFPWYLQAGVAGQYLLGPGLQPSVFGVLILAGLASYRLGRCTLGVALIASAASLHSTYLLPSGLLVGGVIVDQIRQKRVVRALMLGIFALVLVFPILVFISVKFSFSSAEAGAEARRLLCEVRIPHHCLIDRWLDSWAWLQIVWILVGLTTLRQNVLFPVLVVGVGGAVVLTATQWLTRSYFLALQFPWRLSAVLMPIATAAIASVLAKKIVKRLAFSWSMSLASAAVMVALLGGITIWMQGLGYGENDSEKSMLEFVRVHRQSGDVYLLPSRIPAVGQGPRGNVSVTFAQPPDPKSNLIPVDLQGFRLATGAAVYVDFKAVPYLDLEVLEWYRRMNNARKWYDRTDWSAGAIREELLREGITHVVASKARPPRAHYLQPIYQDDAFIVYRINRDTK